MKWFQAFVGGLGATLIILILLEPWLTRHGIHIGNHLSEKALLGAFAAAVYPLLAVPLLILLLGITYSPYALWREAGRAASATSVASDHDPAKISAAGMIFRELDPLHHELERRYLQAVEWIRSRGTFGEIPITGDVALGAALNNAAAAVGPYTANACFKLQRAIGIALQWENGERGKYSGRELAELAQAWVADLLLDLHALADAATSEAGADVRFSYGVAPRELRLSAARVNGGRNKSAD